MRDQRYCQCQHMCRYGILSGTAMRYGMQYNSKTHGKAAVTLLTEL